MFMILSSLREALALESAEQARRYGELTTSAPISARIAEGICWYPLRIVETGYGFGEYPYVVVERPAEKTSPHHLSGGKPAQLFSAAERDQRSVHGTLHWVSGRRAHIILRTNDHPDWLDDGKIGLQIIHDDTSFAEMEKALRRVEDADADSAVGWIRDLLYGVRFRQAATSLPPLPPSIASSLNESQRAAVDFASRVEDLAIIHGPPGTGKTTTLVEIIRATASRARPVLVCAPSNAAVDLLTERCSDAGLDVIRIGNLSRIDRSVISHTLAERWKDHPWAPDIKRLRQQADEYRRLATKYKRSFGRAEMEQRRLLIAEAKSVSADARRMEEQLADVLLNDADVIACTPVGVRSMDLAGREFDTCVLDEAGQGLDPAAWIPILRSRRLILAGDPFQLPPTVMSQKAATAGLTTTMLERAITTVPDRVLLLDEQYRMNRVIMGFSNAVFYGGKVTAHTSVEDHTILDDGDLRSSLRVIDTSGKGWTEEAGDNAESLKNVGEATAVLHVLDSIVTSAHRHDLSVGIISPYRGQVRHLDAVIDNGRRAAFGSLDINTVDSFQGSECDVIIISLVRSNDDGDIGFLTDTRRMNVAITRARKMLVVIGDASTICRHPFYERFWAYAEEFGTVESAWSI